MSSGYLDGDVRTAAAVVICLGVTAWLDRWLGRRSGPVGLWDIGLPLGAVLPLIVSMPEAGQGRAEGLVWHTEPQHGVVRFASERAVRRFPRGLRGVIRLHENPSGGIALTVRWMPPLLPIVASLVFLIASYRNGDQLAGCAISTALIGAVLWLHHRAALVAGRTLRAAL